MGSSIGKWLVIVGLGIALVGIIFWAGSKIGLGKLPGDFHIQKEKWGIYFPIATSIIVSIILTIVLNLVFWLFRK